MRVTTWAYDDETRTVTTTQAPQGLTRAARTDGLNRPLREEVTFTGADYVTSYAYDGLTVAVTDPRGTLTEIPWSTSLPPRTTRRSSTRMASCSTARGTVS